MIRRGRAPLCSIDSVAQNLRDRTASTRRKPIVTDIDLEFVAPSQPAQPVNDRRRNNNEQGNTMSNVTCIRIVGGLALATLVAATPRQATAQCLDVENQRLRASDFPGTLREFGDGIAVFEDTAIIGAPSDRTYGIGAGAVYVFRYNGTAWVEQQKLYPSTPGPGAHFGLAVALQGDTALIGAFRDTSSPNLGAAYIFRFDGVSWTEQQKLVAWDAAGRYFGVAVGLAGPRAVVGAHGDNELGYETGAVYVFRMSDGTWIPESKLMAADGQSRCLGSCVACADDVILAAEDTSHTGAVYVFRRNRFTWTEETKLGPTGSLEGFGAAIALRGTTAFIGSPNTQAGGAVYVFESDASGWRLQDRLVASPYSGGGHFGASLAVQGDTLLVGAWGSDNCANAAGMAYVFRHAGGLWTEQANLLASDCAEYQFLGGAVALAGDAALVGAPRSNAGGVVYAFRGLADCNDNGVLDVCDIVDDSSADEDADGLLDECETPGDTNCDGRLDQTDIAGFVLAVADGAASYWAKYPDCNFWNADVNNNGHVGFDDINPFVDLLTR